MLSPHHLNENSLTNHGSETENMRIYLCRHGETEANAQKIMQGSGLDLPLSSRGREQAEAFALRFKDVKVDCIVSSDLERSRETASYVQKFHPNAQYIEFAELREISWVFPFLLFQGKIDGKVKDGEVLASVDVINQSWLQGLLTCSSF